jgi:hypothetical protein
MGPLQGEFLSALLTTRVSRAWKANSAPWVISGSGNLRSIALPGGMKLTLLSPTKWRKLGNLPFKKLGCRQERWKKPWNCSQSRKDFAQKGARQSSEY